MTLSFFNRSLLIIFLPGSIIACNNNKAEPQDASPSASQELVFDKLVGLWQNPDGKSFERWTKTGDDKYNSVVFSVKGNDTSWNEQASVYKQGDQWVFENLVTGQNQGKPVQFASTLLTENTVEFSNPAHDFPTDIHYEVPDENTVKAFIVGPNQKGGKDTIRFNYTRAK